MKRLVFDVEANGLTELTVKGDEAIPEADRVWCMVVSDLDTDQVWFFYESTMEEGVEMLRSADLIIGHNIILYDVPLLERLYGPIHTKKYDTLTVSRLMYPDRQNHPFGGNSLKAWGIHLGEEKIEYILGFDKYNEDMLKYCLQDVNVTKLIYDNQVSFAIDNKRSIKLEHDVASIIAGQINNGIGFDIEAASLLEHDLLMEKVLIEDDMSEIFPPIVEERWSDKTGKRLKDKTTHFNPASRKQIAERLGKKYGWVAPKTDKGNPKVDSAVLKNLNYPEAKTLARYFDTIKMLSQLSDWILRAVNSRDNRIHGSVNTQGTVTGRMTASQPNLQQVSGDSRTRALFTPREGWVMVGIDAAGLEARLLANRMANWDDGNYGEVVINGDIHSLNQSAAGLSTRDKAKTFFYALVYGAGDGKIGKIVGKRAKEGKEIRNKFLSEMPALRNLIENCQFQVAKKGTITLLDDREVPCRAKHKALNVQIQGDGAVIMKTAQNILDTKLSMLYNDRVAFMATVHDEWQLECDPTIAEHVGQLGVEAIIEAGELLGCVVPMDGNFRIGKNWSECH
mgnify:CR=1 FL=1